VGTPPRNVLEFNQLWQGGARLGGPGISSIINNSNFAPLNVALKPNGQFFKVRSTITGHGAQGEFHQNGGIVNHYFNVNGGPNEFTWQITQECGSIPVFPQGGTWLYDRQGWCPGDPSLLKEHDLTPHVTPGTTVSLDYHCSNPPSPNGDYRYIVANQLITYGAANHSLDAAIIDVLAPSNKVLYSRKNPMCNNPVILVKNTGTTAITSVEINYWLNNIPKKESYIWTGNLAFMDTVTITLPIGMLWQYGTQASGNRFNVELVKVNTVSDQYVYNNTYSSPFNVTPNIPQLFSLEFRTNQNPLDSKYKIVDENGNEVLGASSLLAANTTYTDNYDLTGCYKLIVTDNGGDGLQWWANAGQGVGFVRIKNASGQVIKTFEPDFGNGFEYSFTAGVITTIDPYTGLTRSGFEYGIKLYPNPAHSKFSIEGADLESAEIKLTDVLGKNISVPYSKNQKGLEFNTESLTPGIYFVKVTRGASVITKKVVID
jgi:hypothetical protein